MFSDVINETLSAVVFMTCIGDTALLVILKFTVCKTLPIFGNY